MTVNLRSFVLAAMAAAVPAAAAAQSHWGDTQADVNVSYAFMADSGHRTFNGFRVSAAKNLSSSLALVGEYGWLTDPATINTSPTTTRDYRYTDTTVLGGVRLRKLNGGMDMPFFQILGGLSRRDNDLYTTSVPQGSFAIRTEIGIDFRVSKNIAFRAGGGWTFLTTGLRQINQLGATAGMTVLFGKR